MTKLNKIEGWEMRINIETERAWRATFTMTEKAKKYAKVMVEITECDGYGGWYKKIPDKWLNVNTYCFDEKGNCWGELNPQVRRDNHKIDFDWILKATPENLERILNEIRRRAMEE